MKIKDYTPENRPINKTNNKYLITPENIKYKIYTIRDTQVMLDSDLAKLYGVSTKVLNQAVKRNINKFPVDFMFQLTNIEYKDLRSQFVTLNKTQDVYRKYLPFAFTEHGIISLSGVLKSEIAIKINIRIIRAFISLRKYISKNQEIFNKLDVIERKQIDYQLKTDANLDLIFNIIENKDITPKQGIFFEGQIFDAYTFISKLIKTAQKSIILIDNYIDESVLTLFTKVKKTINITIYTENITEQLKLDIQKYNLQYNSIKINKFKKSHDRFLIIDNTDIYPFGASIKDLGKKWFAFAKLDIENTKIIDKLKQNY